MIFSDIREFFSFVKPKVVKRWFDVENLFCNYFWFYTVTAVIYLVFKQSSIFVLGLPLIIYLLFIKQKKCIKLNIVDILVLINIFWIGCTWILNDFPHKFYIISRSLIGEIAFMIAYWIARLGRKNYLGSIIENARKPLVITCLLGLYCYFLEPAWYLNFLDSSISANTAGNYTKESVLDQFKLRSIFSGGYTLGYLCAMAVIYELFCIFKYTNKQINYYNYRLLYILLLVITSIFALMRAALACSLMGLFLVYFYSVLYAKRIHSTKLLMHILGMLFVFVLIVLSCVDLSTIELLYSKFQDISGNDGSFIRERLLMQANSFSLLGEGFGKYNAIVSYQFGMTSIPDGEYMKIIAEQGFVGLTITMLIFVLCLVKSVIYFKHLYFELFIVLMLLICMIGADPLSTSDKHCIIYWLALGQISNFKMNRNEKNKANRNVPAPISSDTRK